MSNAAATLIVVFAMFGFALYLAIVPPPGFEGNLLHRFALPVLLITGAHTVFENLRTRTNMAQLVGALRALMGRIGAHPTADVKREAIDILVRALRGKDERARDTALRQLRQMTGQDLGEEAAAWEAWWAENRKTFREPSA